MADSSDSEQFSDGESDDDFEVLSGSSESEDEMIDVPMNANPLFHVRPPEMDYLHDKRFSKQHYLSIDESLIASKGRSSMIQYIPSKASKFGVKLWILAEAVSDYICHISVYKGKQYDPTPQGMLQGAYVVNKLLDAAGLFNKAYPLFTDSFVSSINLAKEHLAKGTLFTGTLRANRQMPNTIKNPVLQEKESIYIRKGRILLCAYKERNGRKPVRIISSFSKAAQENDKPAMICSYNKFMGA
ncbi:Hypothetical predicted protein [Mytilus galloprovincialis]|uniref:PiggyBac transposable element-derived protein domain-containing protein n=1 Tax=Mytilus galloprovincialis TaxID=29158 RepID=A0A8B6G565_MYTGA|nr:Hypothetical predicted protein [Mytilus galloprovincialis]